MRNKRIDATTLRPDGERTLYAPLVQMNLNKYIRQLKKEEAWATQDHNTITIYKSDFATIVLRGMHKKSERKTSAANGDMTIQVLRGKISITTEEQTLTLKKGQMIGIEAYMPHSVLAIRDSFFLLTIVSKNED